MARLARLVAPGLPHLIVHRGHNGQAVFTDDGDRALYRQALSESAAAAKVALHGYAILPAEVRLLVTPGETGALSDMMQSLGRSFVRAFNLKHQRSSTPWNGRFRSTVIEAEPHFLSCLRFAESVDPAGMGFAHSPGQPMWSSVSHHLGLSSDPLVTEHEAFWALGNTPFEREAAYRRLLEQPMSERESEAISAAVLKGWPLGSREFAVRMADLTGRRTEPLSKGRPRRHATSAGDPLKV